MNEPQTLPFIDLIGVLVFWTVVIVVPTICAIRNLMYARRNPLTTPSFIRNDAVTFLLKGCPILYVLLAVMWGLCFYAYYGNL